MLPACLKNLNDPGTGLPGLGPGTAPKRKQRARKKGREGRKEGRKERKEGGKERACGAKRSGPAARLDGWIDGQRREQEIERGGKGREQAKSEEGS